MWKSGDTYLSFQVHRVVPLEELQATLVEFKHQASGAKILHSATEDPENLFCLSFQTIPANSNGVAHILEHIVLCGSRKFPVKDPFFAMTRRSLTTYMNALTGADFTCYPAATQVEKDFYNLLEVYLDAVFHPLLKKESFYQEGHRLELIDQKNLQSGLIFKGIVFNEMKGSLASPDSRLWHAVMKALVPDLTYAYVSGGDPAHIPSLTYEELVEFYHTYYTPSRCLFFFYGNFPIKNHLKMLEETVLKHASKLSPLPPLPKQTRFQTPKVIEGVYPASAESNNQTLIAWSWLTVPAQDQDTLLALTLLDAILMENDASLLKLKLLQSRLCTSIEAFFDSDMSEVPYLIVCKGCLPQDVEKLEKVLLTTLQEITQKGIPSSLIEASLHQLELSRTEIGGNHAPFGLSLFLRAALAEQHGGWAEKALKIHSLFEELRQKLKDPSYLPQLLKTVIIDNPHRVRLVMKPDSHLLEREEEKERKNLQELSKKLSDKEKKNIQELMQHLEKFQKSQEGLKIDCLPKVTLNDVPVLARHFPLKQDKTVFTHTAFTNGFTYVDLVMDLPFLTKEELPLAQLFVSLMAELGVGARSYAQNLELWQAHVAGMTASLNLFPQVGDPSELKPALILRGKALDRNTPTLFQLMKEWAIDVHFNEIHRIQELIAQFDTILQQTVVRNGLQYACRQALSGLSTVGYLSEQCQGLFYVQWIHQIAKALPHSLPSIIDKLQALKNRLISFHSPHLVLTCSSPMHEQCRTQNFHGLLDLPTRPFQSWEKTVQIPPSYRESQGRPIASPVAFTCQAMTVASYLNPHAPALALSSHLMDHLVLHPKIREQGGAYGAGSTYTPTLGHFTFHAFRDPHLKSTLQTFQEAVTAILNKKFSNKDLEAAKLEAIQASDAPIPPINRAITTYSLEREGRSLHHRQQFRDRLLALTTSEVALAVEQELIPRLTQSTTVTLAAREFLEKENLALQNRLPIIPI